MKTERERERERGGGGGMKGSRKTVCLLVGCLTSQQHSSVTQEQICSDKFTCCHTVTEVADQTFYLTQSQYTDRDSQPDRDRQRADTELDIVSTT